MERKLEEKMDNIMKKRDVVGAVCADKRGLCMSVRGVAKPEMSGVVSHIADQARKIEPTSSASPVIRLESENGYCLVQKKGDVTLGIFKKN